MYFVDMGYADAIDMLHTTSVYLNHVQVKFGFIP